MTTDYYNFALFMGTVLTPFAALLLIDHVRTRRSTRDGLNSTVDWTPAPPDHVVELPSGTVLTPYELSLITTHLEAGETLEGFTRAAFSPNPTPDWGHSRAYGMPLLFAVTEHRIMLFNFSRLTLRQSCFIPLEDIQYLQPPKPGPWGTSGPVRFGLKSGREYKLMLCGPLLNPEGMQYEQRLVASLRELALQLPSSLAA